LADLRRAGTDVPHEPFTGVYNEAVGRASDTGYEGTSYEDLVIATVSWSAAVAQHMAGRSQRYGREQFDISDAEWATQAARDPQRLVGDGRSRDGDSIRVIGWSQSAPGRAGGFGRLLKVWLAADGPAASGRWIGRTACEANDGERKAYWAVNGEQEM